LRDPRARIWWIDSDASFADGVQWIASEFIVESA
jgi:hypothetical protein